MMLFRMARFALVFLISGSHLLADGKMYAEKVNTKIPYQRALIVHDEGMQTMVLQSQYEIPTEPGKHTLGWVVPVPAVPEVYSLGAQDVESMFFWLSAMSSPEVVPGPVQIFLYRLLPGYYVFCLVGLICSLAAVIGNFPRYRKRIFICGLLPSLIFPAFLGKKGASDVEVIKAGKVGIFDTKVIKAASAKDLIDWFNQHSFRFDEDDQTTIQSYIDRNWCFVTATVDATVMTGNRAAVSSNLLAPLILRFPTSNPVYPTALTATGGHATEILIYLAASGIMKTDSHLVLKSARQSYPSSGPYMKLAGLPEDSEAIQFDGRDDIWLHKFKATLTPEQMTKDIEFHPDPEGKPYRERVVTW